MAVSIVVVGSAGVYEYNTYTTEQQQLRAAEKLAANKTQAATSDAEPSLVASPEVVPSALSVVPELASPTKEVALPEADVQPVLPVTAFRWSAAGVAVDVVPMDWQVGQVVNPPLDANGFDPVAHWIKDSGASEAIRPIVLAAHTCTSQDRRLCNEVTFPFMRLSHEGWAAGQPASIVDATGRTINYTLVDRKVVDKSKAFSYANDRCLLVAFTCNLQNPDGEITLVTFRRTQCGA
jgi:hypothetical protein